MDIEVCPVPKPLAAATKIALVPLGIRRVVGFGPRIRVAVVKIGILVVHRSLEAPELLFFLSSYPIFGDSDDVVGLFLGLNATHEDVNICSENGSISWIDRRIGNDSAMHFGQLITAAAPSRPREASQQGRGRVLLTVRRGKVRAAASLSRWDPAPVVTKARGHYCRQPAGVLARATVEALVLVELLHRRCTLQAEM